ncbi:MAG: hypothetical protein EOO43_21355 [Flavobacterium sp.]|nr:MAG: hypothetical protein EOO43_21355 [Flavobacterium sp.]
MEYYINNQVPRFEKLENRLLKYLGGIEDHILRNNEKVLEMEEIIDQLQRNEQKLKFEIDMISSKVNDARVIYCAIHLIFTYQFFSKLKPSKKWKELMTSKAK